MKDFDIIDETFDRDRTATYELSIQVSLNGFSYAVKDSIRNTFIALAQLGWNGYDIDRVDFRNFLDNLLNDKPWLKSEFKRTVLSFDLPYVTFIPSEYFEPIKAKLLFEQVFPIHDEFELAHRELADDKTQMVFAIPSNFVNEWKNIHPNTLITHSFNALLSVPYSFSKKTYLQVDLYQNQLMLVLHKNAVFIGANSYFCNSATDVVYYVHGFLKSFTNSLNDIHINLMGQGELMAGLSDELQKYFDNVTHQADFHKPIFFSYRLLRYRTDFFKLFNVSITCE